MEMQHRIEALCRSNRRRMESAKDRDVRVKKVPQHSTRLAELSVRQKISHHPTRLGTQGAPSVEIQAVTWGFRNVRYLREPSCLT